MRGDRAVTEQAGEVLVATELNEEDLAAHVFAAAHVIHRDRRAVLDVAVGPAQHRALEVVVDRRAAAEDLGEHLRVPLGRRLGDLGAARGRRRGGNLHDAVGRRALRRELIERVEHARTPGAVADDDALVPCARQFERSALLTVARISTDESPGAKLQPKMLLVTIVNRNKAHQSLFLFTDLSLPWTECSWMRTTD